MLSQSEHNGHPKRDVPKILSIIPEEHRLPGLVFILIESIFIVLAFGENALVRIVCIIGMVFVASVFLFRFFPTRRESAKDSKSIKEREIIEVKDLANLVINVLSEKGGRREDVRTEVKILAADAGNLWGIIEPVIYTKWLRNTSFEFALVDPEFYTQVEKNDYYKSTVKLSFERISNSAQNKELVDKEVDIKAPKKYKYHPNIWGVIIDNSDLFIGFHDWVKVKGRPKLEGTRFGIIHLTKGDPLWKRFSNLFISWFNHTEVIGNT